MTKKNVKKDFEHAIDQEKDKVLISYFFPFIHSHLR